MLSAVHTVAVSRFAAILVAFALTGAPRALAAQPRHSERRCACPAHSVQRACPCGQCHRPSLAARSSAGEKGAACDRQHGRTGQRDEAPARVIGSCGMPEAPATSAAHSAEPFTLPDAAAVAASERAEALPQPDGAPAPAWHELETPPPRRAA